MQAAVVYDVGAPLVLEELALLGCGGVGKSVAQGTRIAGAATIAGSLVGGAQIRRDFPRLVRLAEINTGIEMLRQADGVPTVVV